MVIYGASVGTDSSVLWMLSAASPWQLQSSLYRRGPSGDGLPTAALSNGVVEGVPPSSQNGISCESAQVSVLFGRDS